MTRLQNGFRIKNELHRLDSVAKGRLRRLDYRLKRCQVTVIVVGRISTAGVLNMPCDRYSHIRNWNYHSRTKQLQFYRNSLLVGNLEKLVKNRQVGIMCDKS